ncbi:MAG: AbrB family transcriptional regulator [Chloroflexi bacterium]|nr:AbrB family transcriptional regulator [Chloroflexota bacterium]
MERIEEYVRPLTAKGTVTIPIEVRRLLGLNVRDKVRFRVVDGLRVELLPPPMTLEKAFGSVKPRQRPENFKRLRDTAVEEHIRRRTARRAS